MNQMNKNITSLLIAVIPINAYAHGITNGIVAQVLLMGLWPSLVAIIALLIGIRKKRLKQIYKPWRRASVAFVVIQILMFVYFMVTG